LGSYTEPRPDYTEKQGQYLAFIYYYTLINGYPPAEADMQMFFSVSPPAVHQMVLRLEKKGLIAREPGKSRTIQVLVPRDRLPHLKEQFPQERSKRQSTPLNC
jgi:DNA-binding MarR family transcriptional regulator